MSNRQRLLDHLPLGLGLGLEFGALASPVVPPGTPGIRYVDHVDTAGLRAKYAADPNVDLTRLVPVSHVWDGGGESLARELQGAPVRYVVASHVFEHLPNPIGWLQRLASLLAPGGVVGLIVPDMRYTFDGQRRPSAIPEVLEAWLQDLRRPSIRQVLDHFVHKTQVPQEAGAAALWADPGLRQRVARSHPHLLRELGHAGVRAYAGKIAEGEHIDAHCHVFTPDSFTTLMSEIDALGLLPLTLTQVVPTHPGEDDFIAVLTRAG